MTEPNTLERSRIISRTTSIRRTTVRLCDGLTAEDTVVQSMPDVSPTKWHLAHTTWFFETFVLEPFVAGYEPFDDAFGYLFNSYYEAIGARQPRPLRGLLSRPGLPRVLEYRTAVDEALLRLIEDADDEAWPEIERRIVLGLNHEQQHQELLLMDIKHVFGQNPLLPALRAPLDPSPAAPTLTFQGFQADAFDVGHPGDGFAFDNESPRHAVLIHPFEIGSRLVTNHEYLQFVLDGGYSDPRHWMSDGWDRVTREGWQHPEYWAERDGEWFEFTLGGSGPLDPHRPVCHVSWFEADAFARWNGRRLPTEFEWELAADAVPITGTFLEGQEWHPRAAMEGPGLRQLFGDLWELTQSAYAPYPGYAPVEGALGEYNGKFMANQTVLRGGSCVTPHSHIRATYRNFFYPHQRWAFQGFRLARTP
jgi:ergothioneine biosynthesis protein EgtB